MFIKIINGVSCVRLKHQIKIHGNLLPSDICTKSTSWNFIFHPRYTFVCVPMRTRCAPYIILSIKTGVSVFRYTIIEGGTNSGGEKKKKRACIVPKISEERGIVKINIVCGSDNETLEAIKIFRKPTNEWRRRQKKKRKKDKKKRVPREFPRVRIGRGLK